MYQSWPGPFGVGLPSANLMKESGWENAHMTRVDTSLFVVQRRLLQDNNVWHITLSIPSRPKFKPSLGSLKLDPFLKELEHCQLYSSQSSNIKRDTLEFAVELKLSPKMYLQDSSYVAWGCKLIFKSSSALLKRILLNLHKNKFKIKRE